MLAGSCELTKTMAGGAAAVQGLNARSLSAPLSLNTNFWENALSREKKCIYTKFQKRVRSDISLS